MCVGEVIRKRNGRYGASIIQSSPRILLYDSKEFPSRGVFPRSWVSAVTLERGQIERQSEPVHPLRDGRCTAHFTLGPAPPIKGVRGFFAPTHFRHHGQVQDSSSPSSLSLY
ncbi:hypothetical protein CEXT_380101 [Caerostris extrusa]|uniref:Uncharacterized protein n=1 Tax=Caerostris extrusa TaxID=172846 RepID=A0AAV4TB09_CAEEX|nr:hypothetical protein CEXT_380101 [Caerostris extrusa]